MVCVLQWFTLRARWVKLPSLPVTHHVEPSMLSMVTLWRWGRPEWTSLKTLNNVYFWSPYSLYYIYLSGTERHQTAETWGAEHHREGEECLVHHDGGPILSRRFPALCSELLMLVRIEYVCVREFPIFHLHLWWSDGQWRWLLALDFVQTFFMILLLPFSQCYITLLGVEQAERLQASVSDDKEEKQRVLKTIQRGVEQISSQLRDPNSLYDTHTHTLLAWIP